MKKKEVAKIPESEKIKNPKIYIASHILLEAVKYGSSLSLISSPFFYYLKNIPILKTVEYGVKISALVSVPVYLSKAYKFTEEDFDDRAFRIYHNKIIQDSDKFAIITPFLLAPFMYKNRKTLKGVAELGMAVGTISCFALKKIIDF
eukprot:gene6753-10918_t